LEQLPQSVRQPDIAEAATVAPADAVEADARDVGVVAHRHIVVVREEAEFLRLAVTVVEDDGSLPTLFLIVVEFAEVGDDPLAWPGLGTHTLDQREVGVLLAVGGPAVASQKHPCLPRASMAARATGFQGGRFPLQRQKRVSTTQNTGVLQQK